MASIPQTSIALLRTIAADSDSDRWTEFYDLYQPAMAAYLTAAFPSLEQEDVIQETMIAFMGKVPTYRYEPEVKGHFRNYLIGILKFKAIEALKRRKKEQERRDRLTQAADDQQAATAADEAAAEKSSWRRAALMIALRELMADETYSLQNREIFNRVAIKGESPAQVAEAFGLARNNVDQIKARLMKRLRELVREKESIDG